MQPLSSRALGPQAQAREDGWWMCFNRMMDGHFWLLLLSKKKSPIPIEIHSLWKPVRSFRSSGRSFFPRLLTLITENGSKPKCHVYGDENPFTSYVFTRARGFWPPNHDIWPPARNAKPTRHGLPFLLELQRRPVTCHPDPRQHWMVRTCPCQTKQWVA